MSHSAVSAFAILAESVRHFTNTVIGCRLSDRIEFPCPVVAVHLSENHTCHIIIVLRKIILAQLLTVIVADSDKRIPDHSEVLLALTRLIDIDNKNDLIIGRRQVLQIHEDLLVITFAGTCEIISHVPYTLAAMHKIAEIDNVGVVHKLTVLAYKRAGITVDILRVAAEQRGKQPAALCFGCLIPSKADHDPGQGAAVVLAKLDLLSFLKID